VRQPHTPKVLGDIFEALAGAVFVDCGGDMDVSWRVFQPFLARHLAQLSLPGSSTQPWPPS
jgi:endoribonuclease Dicer